MLFDPIKQNLPSLNNQNILFNREKFVFFCSAMFLSLIKMPIRYEKIQIFISYIVETFSYTAIIFGTISNFSNLKISNEL